MSAERSSSLPSTSFDGVTSPGGPISKTCRRDLTHVGLGILVTTIRTGILNEESGRLQARNGGLLRRIDLNGSNAAKFSSHKTTHLGRQAIS